MPATAPTPPNTRIRPNRHLVSRYKEAELKANELMKWIYAGPVLETLAGLDNESTFDTSFLRCIEPIDDGGLPGSQASILEKALEMLESKGFISRSKASPSGGRMYCRLTDKGRDFLSNGGLAQKMAKMTR